MFLYSTIELLKTFITRPTAFSSDLINHFWSNPFIKQYIPSANSIAALSELTFRLTKDYPKPSWNITRTYISHDGTVKDINMEPQINVEIKTIHSFPFMDLIHFKKQTSINQKPLLIIAPLSGHWPTLLRDTVKGLLPFHDIFLTEWKNPRDIPLSQGNFNFNDYIEYIIQANSVLAENFQAPAWLSVCQPTVPALAAATYLHQTQSMYKPSQLIMIGGPIDARKTPTQVNSFALKHDINWFKSSLISVVPLNYKGFGRRVYPGFLQHMGFVAMNPDRHQKAHTDYFNELIRGDESSTKKHEQFYDEYNAVMDLPADYYLDTIEKVFQKFELATFSMHFKDLLLNTKLIEHCSILSIEGQLDDISGAGQTHAVHQLTTQITKFPHFQWTVPDVGHYGVFSGNKFRTLIAPTIAQFIEKKYSLLKTHQVGLSTKK